MKTIIFCYKCSGHCWPHQRTRRNVEHHSMYYFTTGRIVMTIKVTEQKRAASRSIQVKQHQASSLHPASPTLKQQHWSAQEHVRPLAVASLHRLHAASSPQRNPSPSSAPPSYLQHRRRSPHSSHWKPCSQGDDDAQPHY